MTKSAVDGETITNQDSHDPIVSNVERIDVEVPDEEPSESELSDEYGGLEYEYSFEDYNGDTDSEDFEYENEEHKITVQHDGADRVVKLRIFKTKERELGNWFHNIHATCTVGGKQVGNALGRYVNRESIREYFWRDMEQPSEEVSSIAFELFGRYGYLNEHLKTHCVQKGTGVWGSELDFGQLFLIEQVEITDREWRRNGLGGAMVKALIRKAQESQISGQLQTLAETEFTEMELDSFRGDRQRKERRSKLHIISMPGSLSRDIKEDIKGKSRSEKQTIHQRAVDSSIAFHRTLGFRRIGASGCFGFSSDPNHKSHSLAISDDFDPHPLFDEDVSDDDDEIHYAPCVSFEDRSILHEKMLGKLKEKCPPLHFATLTLPDSECLEVYKLSYAQNQVDWRQTYGANNTLLHLAAIQFLPQSVKWLIGNVNEEQFFTLARNWEGYTPFEALQGIVEESRTRRTSGKLTVIVSDRFDGFPDEAVACLSALLHGEMPDNLPSIQTLRIK